MEIIKPSEISGKIMSLIEDANKFVVIVSPYYNLNKWDKLIKKIDAAKKRNIEFTFFVREPESNSDYQCILEVKKIGFTPIEIERLHAKIYLNESEAIISSMNLNFSSDSNSLDIAVKTESQKEYQEVFKFYEKYIKQETKSNVYDFESFIIKLENSLKNIFPREATIQFVENNISINGRNKYEIFIEKRKSNSLKISCILSGKEFDFLNNNPSLLQQKGKIDFELEEGIGKYYNRIWGTIPHIQSSSFTKLAENEEKVIFETIIRFIRDVEAIKEIVRQS